MKKVFGAPTVLAALAVLGILPLIVAAGSFAEEEKQGSVRTVTGRVEIAEEDEDGNVLAVYIADSSQGDFLVAEDGKGPELFQKVGSLVEAIGKVTEGEEDFDYIIHVREYKVIEED